jgi:hypothetical protein
MATDKELTDKELSILGKHKAQAIKDFKRYGIIDHTKETFKAWECTGLEVELTNYGTDYLFKVTADEKEYVVRVFEGLPHVTLSTTYKGVTGEGCVEPEKPAETEEEAVAEEEG